MTAVTPGSAELLEPCPFCGKPLTLGSRKINPKAYCEIEDCYGRKMSVVNLDDPICVKAWNTRLAAKPAEDGVRTIWVSKDHKNQLDFNRVYTREPSAEIKRGYARSSWKIVALEVRELSTTEEPKR